MELSRELSTYENLFRCRKKFGFYNNFVVTGQYSIKLTENLISQILHKLLINYHMLASNIFKIDGKYCMKAVKVEFNDIVKKLHQEYIDDDGKLNESGMKFLNSIDMILEIDKPLIRIYYNDNILSVIFDHSLFDGVVGNYFHQEFLSILQSMDSIEESTLEFLPILFDPAIDEPKNPLPPPIDNYLDYTKPHGETFHLISPDNFERFNGRFPNDNYSLAFKLINIPNDSLQKILLICKKNNVALTSYIQTIFLLSFKPVFQNKFTEIKIAIALRRYINDLPSNYKIMGNSPHLGLGQNIPPVEKFNWDLVNQININLKRQVNNEKLLNTVKPWYDSYNSINDDENENFFTPLFGKHYKAEITKLSNLGFIRFDNPTVESDITINDLIFSQDLSSISSDFMISAVSTKIGGLNIVVTYFDHSFEDFGSNFDHLVENFKDNLVKYAV